MIPCIHVLHTYPYVINWTKQALVRHLSAHLFVVANSVRWFFLPPLCVSLDEESTKLSSISVILSSAFRPLHCWIIITKSDQSRLERQTHTNTDQVFQGDVDDDDNNWTVIEWKLFYLVLCRHPHLNGDFCVTRGDRQTTWTRPRTKHEWRSWELGNGTPHQERRESFSWLWYWWWVRTCVVVGGDSWEAQHHSLSVLLSLVDAI